MEQKSISDTLQLINDVVAEMNQHNTSNKFLLQEFTGTFDRGFTSEKGYIVKLVRFYQDNTGKLIEEILISEQVQERVGELENLIPICQQRFLKSVISCAIYGRLSPQSNTENNLLVNGNKT